MFEHYWQGSGTDYRLSTSDFNYILKNGKLAESQKKFNDEVNRQLVDGYVDPLLNRAIGTGTVYIDKKTGNPVGFYDYYDFDSKPWFGKDSRRFKNEIITRSIYYYNKFIRSGTAKPFNIRYGKPHEKNN